MAVVHCIRADVRARCQRIELAVGQATRALNTLLALDAVIEQRALTVAALGDAADSFLEITEQAHEAWLLTQEALDHVCRERAS